MKREYDKKLIGIGLVIFVVALLIRLIGINWGLPNQDHYFSYHPDEPVILAYSQQVNPAKGDFTPGFYNYGTLYLTLLNVTSSVVESYSGLGENSAAWEYSRAFHLGGRWLSALAGAGTSLFIFLILYRKTSLLGSIFGASAMGIAPAFLMHSRFQTVDVLATFFLTVSFYFGLQLMNESSIEDALSNHLYLKVAGLSGLFAGLSAGTKYTGILALVCVFTLCIVQWRMKKWDMPQALKVFGVALGVAIVTFLITTPGALLESDKFIKDFIFELNHTSTGHGLVFAGTGPGFIYHIASLVDGYGGLLLILSLIGLVWAVKEKEYWIFGLIAFGLLTYILIGKSEVKFIRYTFPLMPGLAVGFGWLVGKAHQDKNRRNIAFVAAAIIALGGMRGGLSGVVRVTGWMTAIDPRDEIAEVLKKESSPETTIGIVKDPWFYTPPFYPEANSGPMQGSEYRFDAMRSASQPQIIRWFNEDGTRSDWDIDLIEKAKPDLIIFSSFEAEGYPRILQNPPKEFEVQAKEYSEFMEALIKNYQQDIVQGQQSARIHDLMYVRPTIWVWKKKNNSESISSDSSNTSNTREEPADTQ